jgi:hypothetical protein
VGTLPQLPTFFLAPSSCTSSPEILVRSRRTSDWRRLISRFRVASWRENCVNQFMSNEFIQWFGLTSHTLGAQEEVQCHGNSGSPRGARTVLGAWLEGLCTTATQTPDASGP